MTVSKGDCELVQPLEQEGAVTAAACVEQARFGQQWQGGQHRKGNGGEQEAVAFDYFPKN